MASTLVRLNEKALPSMGEIAPPYDRSALEPRILHIGPGAFFRAHQADYIDRLNAIDPKWGITALSLRSTSVSDALTPQDGLYSLVTLDREVSGRVIGSVIGVHHAGEASAEALFLSRELRLITLTITEKGYCLTPDGTLDEDHPDICADLADPDQPVSAIGWIVHGLALRFDENLPAPIILSCDNLPGNGEKLSKAIIGLARLQDGPLADWIEDNCLFPGSMVDSITPATDGALVERVRKLLGIDDAWPIQREAFTDWVIESTDDPRMPPLDRVGAIFSPDVEQYEQAKLRLLNGAHSALAYIGLAKGHASVAEAMADPDLAAFVAGLMEHEIRPSLEGNCTIDLKAYQADLLHRFCNPAIVHNLSQIAWDGSKKLPIRLLATISDNLVAGRSIERLALAVAAWWRFVIRMTRAQKALTDPLAATLSGKAARTTNEASGDIDIMLTLDEIFPRSLTGSKAFRLALLAGYDTVMASEQTLGRQP